MNHKQLCIHGHFYQPPRENPWTGEIETQHAAKPYHDWNEKIWNECYRTNTEAEILNQDKIVDIVNNYKYISFNFGPTLFDWLVKKHPETINRIIQADRKSIQNHKGHGNAIAQVYNHVIMPLTNLQDKVTQVRWGIKHFEYYFGRHSEGIWLPETACNQDTIEVLIHEDIKYIILDSSQAEKFRESGDSEWIITTEAPLIPHVAYQCYSEINSEKYINIFFYDGPISKAVAFDDVLVSSQQLLNKIEAIKLDNSQSGLISIATDGETFGHHKKNAERTLAYFLKVLAPANNIKLMNFGEYLEAYPAKYEVKIKKGKNGEGTSWSCVHGVERWNDDCGCGGGEWNQKWRRPLRNTLNYLRDELIKIYEIYGGTLLNNIWYARNDYIGLMLNNNEEYAKEYFTLHAKKILSHDEVKQAYNLLEMQRYAMLMFTSCGWFFSEISGLETVKILEYAKRAMELAKDITGTNLEPVFLKGLEAAPSNLKKYKNGKIVYEKLVSTSLVI